MIQITKHLLTTLLVISPLTLCAKDYQPDDALTYKKGDSYELKLHQFKPEGLKASDSRTAVVFFFGGSWVGGAPKQFYQQADFFADQGIVAFSAEYRVKKRNKTTPFDAVEDAKSAIRWVREHAAELGVDPNKIIASGGSAGGHIAGSTGVIKGLEAAGEDHSISSIPNAMILFNPVLDTTETGYGLNLVGKKRKTEVSLTHHVKEGIVPTLIIHGTNDKTVPFENAERFQKLMEEAGNDCQLIASEGQGHGFFNSPFFRPGIKNPKFYDQSLSDSLLFLKKHKFMD